MKQILFAALSALLLTACIETGVKTDIHTGTTVVHSKQYSVQSNLLQDTTAMAGYSNKNGYSVVVQFVATGQSWKNFSEAWSYGKQFTFVPAAGKSAGCAAGCTLVEGGAIRMTEDQFRSYSKTGFTFKLVGSGGDVVGSLPAAAFQEVLVLMGN